MTDAFDEWRRLREIGGRRVTVIDLYELVARPRGLEAHELPQVERERLARTALSVTWPGFSNTPGSDRPVDPIQVVEYDQRWPEQYERWRAMIVAALGDVALRIEHVGSTAVPGLPAKPVIDVQVSVVDIECETDYVAPLENAGLQLRTRDDLRRFFRPFPDRPRTVHVHVCPADSQWESDHLLFRDYLRTHPDAREEYASTKRLAAERWWDDRIAYTDAKTDVVLDIMGRAHQWVGTDATT